ncbi:MULTISPECIES: hypothetical protein [unclassified Empedobacter]|uniref:hypothetical protein n=1 Tax=unclassified Empedobacter TaxID=2643773 RepID=UPI0024497D2F|nr:MULTISPECIES: hypothetical protein [unclassified Empedobacter]MDH1881179.1 hypothetical protein [Empedobacter sp. GD03797]
MGLQVEFWHDTIQEKLLQDNTFLQHIADVSSDNIINGTIVHIPQAGEPSKVVKNRTLLPAAVAERKDSEILYSIDEYTTDPVRIKNADTVELSYDKRRSILDQDIANLSEEVAEGMLTNMVVSPVGDNKELPSKNILLTEGELVDATLPGSTGKRHAHGLKDLQRMKALFKAQKAWTEGQMYALLTSEAIAQMFPVDSQVVATYMAATSETERRAGVIYKVQGWSIMERSSVYVMDSTSKEFKAFGAVGEATDTEGNLFWNKNMVEKAIGTTQAFESIGDPTYYGDIYSFLVRTGGRARRKNYEGVAVLMQAAGV